MSRCTPVLVFVTVLLFVTLLLSPRAYSAGPRQEGSLAYSSIPGPAGDLGSGWIQDRYFSSGYAVDIAAAGNGDLWAAISYRDAGTGCGDGVDLYSSSDGGYLWTQQNTINDCSAPWFYEYWNASIAVDVSNDRVYVAAERNDTSLVVVHGDPVGGWTWSVLAASGGAESHPDVVAENDQGAANRIYVAMVWNIGAGDNIGLYFSEDDGAVWTFLSVAGDVDPIPRDQPTAAYANGWLWIAFRYANTDIYFANSNVGLGTPFTINTDILAANCALAGTTCQWPEVAVVRDGSLGALVYEYNSPSADVDILGVGSVNNGANWSPPFPFATSAASETAPSITVDYMASPSNGVAGQFHVVFVQGSALFHQAVNSGPLAFGPLTLISDSPIVVAGDNGYRTTVTTQLRGGAWFPAVGMVEAGTDSVLYTTPGWTSTFDTAPPGLEVIIDGVQSMIPFWASWPANTTHRVEITTPQAESPGLYRYVFDRWDSGNPQNHTWTAPDLADAQAIALFVHQWWVTVDSDPPALDISVDGVLSAAPWSDWWNESESHALNVTPTQAGASGERFSWKNWTDGGAQGHDVNVTGVGTFVAAFARELQVDVTTDPPGFGGINVDSVPTGAAPFWWAVGEVHMLEADPYWMVAPGERRSFVNWSDGSSAPLRTYTTADLVVGGPEVLEARYPVTEYRVTITSDPPGLDVQVDGQWIVTPQPYWWVLGSMHDFALNLTQPGWTFAQWMDGSAALTSTLTVMGPTNWTAYYTVSLLSVTAEAAPPSGAAPLTVSFTATASDGTAPYNYTWTFGDGTTGFGASPTHTYLAAGTYQANVTVIDSVSNTTGRAVTVIVFVAPLLLDHCTVTPDPAHLTVGGTQVFAARGFTNGGVEIPGTTATWTVSGSFGTISPAGLFTANATGGGAVEATMTYDTVTRSCSAGVLVETGGGGPTPVELPWLLILLILVIAIGLFLLLWMRRKKPAESPPAAGEEPAPTTLSPGTTAGIGDDSTASLLKRLREARDQNTMTEDEYQAARDALLGKL